jgi:hypothetical protein
MSVPSTVHGGYFMVAVEADPVNSPDVFTIICGLNSKTLAHQSSTSTDAVPDCGDPEATPGTIWSSTANPSRSAGPASTTARKRH